MVVQEEKDGNIKVFGNSNRIHAYNGSYITTEDAISQSDEWKINSQSIIYAQLGYSLELLRDDKDVTTKTTLNLKSYLPESWLTKNINPDIDKYSPFDASLPKVVSINARTAVELIAELQNNYRSIDYSVYNTYGNLGIGSGAGYIEISNGTYTVDASMDQYISII